MSFINIFQSNVTLTSTEKYLLEWVNQNPDDFINLKIQEIAKRSNCSTSAITRLVQKLEFESLQQMKIRAREKLSEVIKEYKIVDETSLSANLVNLNTYHSYSIKETLRDVDTSTVEWIVDHIINSKKTLLFGVGSSKRACAELESNLVKIGYNAFFNDDIHTMLLYIPMLSKNDLVIIVSKSCMTSEVKYLINVCHELDIPCVVLTSNYNFPEKEKATKVLNFVTYEQPYRITAISSKVAQLIVTDLIFTEVFNRNYDKNIKIIENATKLVNRWNGKIQSTERN
jgi:DNA-binding MurR/RpiR family transcriptional regulator